MAYIAADHYARKAIQAKRKSTGAIKHQVELDLSPRQMVITIPVPRKVSMVVKAKQAQRLEVISSQMVQLLDLLISAEECPEEYFKAITRSLVSVKSDLRCRNLAERSCGILSGDLSENAGGSAVLRTKTAQETIGVHSPLSLKKAIERASIPENTSFADLARACFEHGLQELDRRLWEEGSHIVLRSFGLVLQHYAEPEKEQWSLRLSKPSYAKAIAFASEHELSRSNLAAMCIAVGVKLLILSRKECSIAEGKFQTLEIG